MVCFFKVNGGKGGTLADKFCNFEVTFIDGFVNGFVDTLADSFADEVAVLSDKTLAFVQTGLATKKQVIITFNKKAQ